MLRVIILTLVLSGCTTVPLNDPHNEQLIQVLRIYCIEKNVFVRRLDKDTPDTVELYFPGLTCDETTTPFSPRGPGHEYPPLKLPGGRNV